MPESLPLSHLVDGVGDLDEVLEELGRHVLVDQVVGVGQLQSHVQHDHAEERHPGGPVRLLQLPAGRERLAPVEQSDVVQPQEPPGENVPPVGVLPVHPPVEVEHQLLEGPSQEAVVAVPAGPRDLVHAEAGPRVDGRVHVVEGELVGGDLSVRVHVPLAQEQDQLLLGEVGVHLGVGDHVERQVPGGVPRVLPLVRHGDDLAVEEVRPVGVAAGVPGLVGSGHVGVSPQPVLDGVVVELFAPEQTRVRLPHHLQLLQTEGAGEVAQTLSGQAAVEGVGFRQADFESFIKERAEQLLPAELGLLFLAAEHQSDLRAGSPRHFLAVVRGALGPFLSRIHGALLARSDEPVEGVLDEGGRAVHAVQPLVVRLVLSE